MTGLLSYELVNINRVARRIVDLTCGKSQAGDPPPVWAHRFFMIFSADETDVFSTVVVVALCPYMLHGHPSAGPPLQGPFVHRRQSATGFASKAVKLDELWDVTSTCCDNIISIGSTVVQCLTMVNGSE